MGKGLALAGRVDNWTKIFNEELEKPRKFSWGSCDCCQFAFSVVGAITGVKVGAEPLGHYSGPISAYKWLKKHNYASIKDWVDNVCAKSGFEAIHPNLAKRGDLVMTLHKGDQTFGVMADHDAVFLSADDNYINIPRRDLAAAWSVG